MAESALTTAAADALSGTTDSDLDITHNTIGESTYYTTDYQKEAVILRILKQLPSQLRVYKDGDLTCGIRAGRFMDGATTRSYAGAAAQALTNNTTNYIYLTAAAALTINATGFPSSPHVPLATILTASGVYAHTDITDYRGEAALRVWRQDLAAYNVPLDRMKKTADLLALPTAGDATNLGFVAGTHGTNTPKLISTAVAGGASETEKCRFLFQLPPEYISGETVTLRIHARANDPAATSVTLDAEVYECDEEAGEAGGGDICATGAQSINTTDWAGKDFTITPTGSYTLAPGEMLDIELTVALDDAASGDGAQAEIGAVKLLLDIRK